MRAEEVMQRSELLKFGIIPWPNRAISGAATRAPPGWVETVRGLPLMVTARSPSIGVLTVYFIL